MADISVFLPKVRQYAPGAAEPAAYDAIREAVIEFCDRTRLWRDKITETTAAFGPITLTPAAGAAIADIDLVRVEGRQLERVSSQYLDDRYGAWRDTTFTGTPSFVTQLAEDEITIVPWAACDVDVYVRYRPTNTTETIPDFIADGYASTIQAGALARLLMIPGQPFTNPDLAMAFAQRFQADLDQFAARPISGQQRAPVRTKAQFF